MDPMMTSGQWIRPEDGVDMLKAPPRGVAERAKRAKVTKERLSGGDWYETHGQGD